VIEAGAVVVVHCSNPREKLWGLLLRLDAVGVVLRAVALDSVEDWLRQELTGGEQGIAPSTLFIPTPRLDRIYLDESSGVVQGFADRYHAACGHDVREALARAPGGVAR
jgi:hypothetical protein